ncbi:hypothetical protein FSP39_003276 [Pinctada imbricata]|uniref:Piezo-type mechanosensitive ion channel component n=1 Tax=Pinctada imbricata TaxID=66713 RepID=A0AA88XHG9_PINIB|nr:hypothetical protein FSP39_003276 [Pinctada imbricata]
MGDCCHVSSKWCIYPGFMRTTLPRFRLSRDNEDRTPPQRYKMTTQTKRWEPSNTTYEHRAYEKQSLLCRLERVMHVLIFRGARQTFREDMRSGSLVVRGVLHLPNQISKCRWPFPRLGSCLLLQNLDRASHGVPSSDGMRWYKTVDSTIQRESLKRSYRRSGVMAPQISKVVCRTLFTLLLPLILLAGYTGIYLILIIVISGLGTLCHIVFHITLAAIATDAEPYGYDFPNCSQNEKIARTIAVERLDGVPFIHVLRLVFPDVFVLIASVLVYVLCRIFLKPSTSSEEQQSDSGLPLVQTRSRSRQRVDTFLYYIGEFLVVLLLAACGIIVPSLISAIYFLSFLFIATWWSFYRRLGRKFCIFRVFILVWSGLHILVLYLCQIQIVQDDILTDNTSLVQRLLGLTEVIKVNCDRPWEVQFHDAYNWPFYVNPALILVLYFIVAIETKRWYLKKSLHAKDGEPSPLQHDRKKSRRKRSSERQVLPEHSEQHESLVDAEQQQSYSTFEERQEKREEDPGTPTMVDSDDEPDGGADSKVKEKKPRRKKDNVKRSTLISIFVYTMKQSYVLTLIAMMAWSITFHSWLTFVLLLAACFIWMVPQSRRACLLCSPVIMLYGECLLLIQFVYGLQLTTSELPSKVNGVNLEEIGLKRYQYPCLQLGLQVLFTAMFWLAVRQWMRERQETFPSSEQEVQMESLKDGSQGGGMGSWLSSYIWEFLAKYWILVCTGMMLIISLQEVVIYRIIYLFLLLYFVLAFQMCYKIWRLTMYIFWWVVIVYSMIVLIVVYTYQFQDFPGYWKKTGLSDQVLSDIGLRKFDIAGLFTQLLTPTSFVIVIILQVHYFHNRFLVINNIERTSKDDLPLSAPGTSETDGGTTTETESKILRKTKRWKRKCDHYFRKIWTRCSEIWAVVSAILWRVTEIHIVKVVLFVIVMVCVTEVSCISAVYMILISLFLPITGAWQLMSHLCQVWTAIVLLAKMIYQLNIVEKDYWNSNCTLHTGNGTDVINNAEYVGLDKTDKFLYYARNYIGIMLILAFERVVYYHQYQTYNQSGMPRPMKGVIFPEIKRPDADRGLLSCAKFFANYFFYKYGLEICYIMIAGTISIRVDVFSVIYAIILGILLLLSRQGNARIWPIITIILALLLPIQYLMVLGMPQGLCYEYPWDSGKDLDRNLEKWLFLPDFNYPPEAIKLVADFFLLLFVCLQWLVFRMEATFRREQQKLDEYGGGDNSDILVEVEANRPVPVLDFTSHIHSYLDVLKNGFFTYMFWVTLFIVFIAGTIRINLFSLGYVIAVFCFMWYGQEFIIYPLRTVRKKWKYLIFFNYLVLLLKAALQLLGCVYITDPLDLYNNQCWVVQLLGLTCLHPSEVYQPGKPDSTCVVEEDDTGLMWDVVCFTFLLLQLRIYNSHYFRHVVSSTEAQNNLSSRGAQLINNILIQAVQEQKEREKKVLQKIKKKMHILKAKQKKSAKADFIEPDDHFQAIRSGDYYLFEENDMDDEDPTTISIGRDTSDEEEEEGLDPIKLISTAIESGADAAVKQTEEAEESKEEEPEQKKEEDKEEQEDECSEEEEKKEPSKLDKVKNIFILILKLIEGIADTLINIFNDISKNYRMVADSLEEDMKSEKEKIRLSKSETKVKTESLEVDVEAEDGGASADSDGKPSSKDKDRTSLVEIEIDVPASEDTTDGARRPIDLHKKKEKFEKSKPKIFQLLEATYYVIVARSEFVCYFLMILNVIVYASLLSLPLPLMVFLWAMLSVPRPSKTFWITVITYTEAVVVVKYLFQFGFFPWNEEINLHNSPFWPPRIIGIEKRDHYATADLVLLLALFIHRSILKRYGLWKDAEDITADLNKAEQAMSTPTTPVPVDGAETEEPEITKGAKQLEITDSIQSTSGRDTEDSASLEEGGKDKKKKEKPSLSAFLEPFREFYRQLTNPAFNATTDVYASMFLCDFINFVIIVLGYSAFGPVQSTGRGDVTSYITENKVPVLFLIMLLAQFFLIVIDRALYLRKNVLGKFIFQIILVILIHIWMFFILPLYTERKFSDNTPAQLFYFIKCVYFALSAYQIRSSYPTRILGNFLTKKYNYVNLFLFKGFLAIPFLLELRVVMDWMWTDSTLAIGSWLQMEDIYANIYVLKCWRESERKYPTPRSVKKRKLVKYGVGGLLLILIIFIIWFPLVVFSFANTIFVPNIPVEVSTAIAIGGYQPIFQVQAQGSSIQTYTPYRFKGLLENFNGQTEDDRRATSFINAFEYNDVCSVTLNGQSTSNWGISPPSKEDLIKSLNDSNSKVTLEFDISFRRQPKSGDSGQTLSNQYVLELNEKNKDELVNMIQNPLSVSETNGVRIEHVFPKFFHLTSTISHEESILQEGGRTNVTLMFKRDNSSGVENQWWEVQELYCGSSKTEPKPCDSVHPTKSSEDITLVILNDRVAPPEGVLSKITGYGIIGLYITFILLIGRILRLSTTGLQEGIAFKELPYVDNILRLCLDIYLVREMVEFRLEEDLYAKLLFVYRSPETMIKWTRLPNDLIVTDAKKND